MSYKKSQVAEYGPSFVPWEEEQFSQMLGSLTGGLPLNSIACVVCPSFAWLIICPYILGTITFRVEMDENTVV